MSYSRVMPNIKPYPYQDMYHPTTDMSFQIRQQQKQPYSVYRPAYHRIPSTPAIVSRQSKDAWAAMSPEVSPIIVPSMSPTALQPQFLDFYPSNGFNYTSQGQNCFPQAPTVHKQSPIQNYHHQTAMRRIPIHHTLENATITYDTIEQGFQKDLVKDVFFSPAMITSGREMSPSSESCTYTQSDSDSDYNVSTPPYHEEECFSPHETPSDLLMDQGNEALFDFGLDLATTSATSNQTVTSSYEEVMIMAQNKKKPSFKLTGLSSKKFEFNTQHNLPTPPASSGDSDYSFHHQHYSQHINTNKRRCSDSVLQDRMKKKQRHNSNTAHLRTALTISANNTPPTSPLLLSALKNETLFESSLAYFEEESNRSAKRSSLEYNRFDSNNASNLDAASEIQSLPVFEHSDEEDSFSTTSWEEEEEEVVDEESEAESEEDEDFKAPVKYTPKKYKKSMHSLMSKKLERQQQFHSNTSCIEEINDINNLLPKASPRATSLPTIYQKLTKANVDWCRYCGTTEGVNWRPGPWGKRTLCNKHGCDYKGYGFACKLPRLDLTSFVRESIDERDRPVLQLYCSGCQRKDSWQGNVLVRCEGCPKAFHQKCHSVSEELSDEFVSSNEAWFCNAACCENARRKRIVVELPRKRLPLMRAPKSSSSSSSSSVTSESSISCSRSLRESSFSSAR